MSKAREILRLKNMNLSQREIAVSCRVSRNTVSETLARAALIDLKWPLPDDLDDGKLSELLYPEKKVVTKRREPDFEAIHKELSRAGVTLTLLWHEYCDRCHIGKEQPLMYSQFCDRYRRYAMKTKATMHIEHKPGEQLYVDWAGNTALVVDRETGVHKPAYLFVSALGASKYTYVEAFPDMGMESWIAAHVNNFEYLGGTPRILVPDNLKTGVDKASNFDPVINKAYYEMASYYDCAVVPARVRKPKDKPIVESGVGDISTWITAALRNCIFFSFNELNQAIAIKLKEYNVKPFQKLPGSRLINFVTEERSALQGLPPIRYELATWKVATVQFNYHIGLDSMYYSVPYEFIKYKVDVRITRNIVEIFYQNRRICSHPRLYGKPNQYHTIPEHMPPDHQKYLDWNSERFLSWSRKVGTNTEKVIQHILSSRKVEQQAYKACFGILKLADKYSLARLENACKRAMELTSQPSYKNIESILKNNQDALVQETDQTAKSLPKHKNIRGAEYYRGGNEHAE